MLMIVGHTHERVITWLGEHPREEQNLLTNHWYTLSQDTNNPVLINPGSIGYPRDDHQRGCASYALLEITDQRWRVCFRDVWFDRREVIALLNEFGYPPETRQGLDRDCPDWIAHRAGPDILTDEETHP
jgi:quinol monooxygenase YgiN